MRRRLIVNADDFGRSHSINQAVIRAHREGILTTTSLMVNEVGFDEAVELARENPKLGVGLHLTTVCGKSVLPPERIPNLVDAKGEFTNNPASAGMRYFFSPACRRQLREEITAQFEKFHATGLPLDHVNGHLHLHMHPAIFSILVENANRFGIRRMRLTNDRFFLNARIASGEWIYRIGHTIIFKFLSTWERRAFERNKFAHTDVVFGLLQNARVDEDYVTKLLPELPSGASELYSHPSLDQYKNEFDALVSPKTKALVQDLDIELIRYGDL
ncbi:MAG: hopanoid biosynthesis-associated protein HpnK [Limisphaerales bacterium]